ncbi:dynein regulatory complex subunit 5 isoform X2 [Dendropsophus ebraccatus]|uniref:dynein regulatory complex subunit 5 isoform X2 n=1 Tax=Dendropsophus ebraccatus TaxID=150705 RepID=UPI003831D05A
MMPDPAASLAPLPVHQRNAAGDPRRMRRIITEDSTWSLALIPPLSDLCLRHIVGNFQDHPILDQLLPKHQSKVLDSLSTSLPLPVTTNLISYEDYWRRCCTERWPTCDVSHYGFSWKRLFFEKHLENLIENFIPDLTDTGSICNMAELSKNYIRRLDIQQLLPPVFRLHRSKVDDDKVRVLIKSLLDHPTLVQLDLSHNQISDRGARAMGKLLNQSQLQTLNLCNNNIRPHGAQAIAHSLTKNSRLQVLNLRLNHIGDEGGQALCNALLQNNSLQWLHIGSNELSEPTATLLAQVLSQNTSLKSINISCNPIGLDGGKQLLEGMSQNKTMLEFDLRLTDVGQESEFYMNQVLRGNQERTRLLAQQKQLSTSGLDR